MHAWETQWVAGGREAAWGGRFLVCWAAVPKDKGGSKKLPHYVGAIAAAAMFSC
jgi:hypothetical protein